MKQGGARRQHKIVVIPWAKQGGRGLGGTGQNLCINCQTVCLISKRKWHIFLGGVYTLVVWGWNICLTEGKTGVTNIATYAATVGVGWCFSAGGMDCVLFCEGSCERQKHQDSNAPPKMCISLSCVQPGSLRARGKGRSPAAAQPRASVSARREERQPSRAKKRRGRRTLLPARAPHGAKCDMPPSTAWFRRAPSAAGSLASHKGMPIAWWRQRGSCPGVRGRDKTPTGGGQSEGWEGLKSRAPIAALFLSHSLSLSLSLLKSKWRGVTTTPRNIYSAGLQNDQQ
jgi:hypothetical protein